MHELGKAVSFITAFIVGVVVGWIVGSGRVQAKTTITWPR